MEMYQDDLPKDTFRAITDLQMHYDGTTYAAAQITVQQVTKDNEHRIVPTTVLPLDLAHDLRLMLTGGSGFIVNWSLESMEDFALGYRLILRRMALHQYYPPARNLLRIHPFRLDVPGVK